MLKRAVVGDCKQLRPCRQLSPPLLSSPKAVKVDAIFLYSCHSSPLSYPTVLTVLRKNVASHNVYVT